MTLLAFSALLGCNRLSRMDDRWCRPLRAQHHGRTPASYWLPPPPASHQTPAAEQSMPQAGARNEMLCYSMMAALAAAPAGG